MSLRYYADVHFPGPITEGLRQRGFDILTAQADGMARAEDPDLLDRAAALGRVLLTQDDDLLAEAASRQRDGVRFADVVYGHQRDTAIGGWIADLELLAQYYEAEAFESRVEYLPLK